MENVKVVETRSETFYTPLVADHITQFPQEHLEYVKAQGYDEAKHERLERYASDDENRSQWTAALRSANEIVEGEESGSEGDGEDHAEEANDNAHQQASVDFTSVLEATAAQASPLSGTAVPLSEDDRDVPDTQAGAQDESDSQDSSTDDNGANSSAAGAVAANNNAVGTQASSSVATSTPAAPHARGRGQRGRGARGGRGFQGRGAHFGLSSNFA